jgi:hypothetical protein
MESGRVAPEREDCSQQTMIAQKKSTARQAVTPGAIPGTERS